MNRWENKAAIVTGANGGIGAAICEELAKAGVKVVGFARNKQRLDSLAKKIEKSKGKFYAVACDIAKDEDILKAFKWVQTNVGPIHILVNGAGIFEKSSLTDGDAKLWRNVFETNVIGLCVATREAIKDMKAHNVDGHIIHLNSLAGHVVFGSNINVYSASKFAVTALSETLRQELTAFKSKIKVTSVSPGFVDTDMSKNAMGYLLGEKVSINQLQTEDVAGAVMYALSTPPHVQVQEIMLRHV